ncbi:phosphatase PAP2 family protein [Thermodesulfobacteriota bacterium]
MNDSQITTKTLQPRKIPLGFLALAATAVLVMVVITPVDYRWSIFFHEHNWPIFSKFIGQTIFEGEGLGSGDPVIVFLLLSVTAYYLAWKKPPHKSLLAWRPQLGYIVASGLISGVFLVHSLKWIMGRARPYLVLSKEMPFSAWYEWGPHFVTEGIYRGSFPSGHTAQIFLLMTVAYILAADPGHRVRWRVIGWLWGGFTVLISLAVGIARCMTLSHWISDVLGIIFLSWLTLHILYFRILRIPQQTQYYKIHGQYPATPQIWELRLCGYLFFVFLGFTGAAMAVRSIFRGEALWLLLLGVLGIPLIIFCGRRIQKLYGNLTPVVAPADNSNARREKLGPK